MEKEGFRNRTGKALKKSTLHRILTEPFYHGRIIWKGKEYEGKHEPIISEEVFDEVQLKLRRPLKVGQYKKHNHTFKGLIRCGECGCLISWETQKGHHYGHCKKFKPCTQKGYAREVDIEKALFESLSKIKPAISETKITYYSKSKNIVKFEYRDKTTNEHKTISLSVNNFIGLLIRHIPDKHFHMIRYYGIHTNARKNKIFEIISKQITALFGMANLLFEFSLNRAKTGMSSR